MILTMVIDILILHILVYNFRRFAIWGRLVSYLQVKQILKPLSKNLRKFSELRKFLTKMADRQNIRARHFRGFRPRKNVLEMYDDAQLVKIYRFDSAGIIYITDLVRHALKSPTARNQAIARETKVALTLPEISSHRKDATMQ